MPQPALRRHARGQFFARWGGRDHYFGTDRAAAERAFLDPAGHHPGSLVRWMAWRTQRRHVIARPTIAALARDFLAEYHAQSRRDTEAYYRKHLRRFLATFGALHPDELDEAGIAAFRADMLALNLQPRTIGHDLRAVGTLWRWALDRRLAPPLNLRLLRAPRVARSVPEPLSLDEVRAAIARVGAAYPTLTSWLSVNYLCLLRPSEVCRLAPPLSQGRSRTIPAEGRRRAEPGGAIELIDHKTAHRQPRIIVLSPQAATHLPLLPLPGLRASRLAPRIHALQNRYALLCRRAGAPGLPHRLRDSAATHLLELGEERGVVDLLLGHAPRGELATYGRASLRLLRRSVSRLAL